MEENDKNIIFRRSEKNDIPRILEFIKEQGFTERSLESWRGEAMDAAVATVGDDIIGVIPFSVRTLKIRDGHYVAAAHVSAVAVKEEFRSQGIGSRLVAFIKDNFTELDCLVVNRDHDNGNDRAYKWYGKNGFIDATDVRCLYANAAELKAPKAEPLRAVISKIDDDNFEKIDHENLSRLFEATFKNIGGFEKRDKDFWTRRFKYHYYKKLNAYYLFELFAGDVLAAYAIGGKNFIYQKEGKIDVFEYGLDPRRANIKDLTRCLADFCLGNNIPVIRFLMAKEMELYADLLALGFKDATGFKFMILPLKPDVLAEKGKWTFLSFDYI